MRRLARRSYSRGELSERMRRAGYSPEEIETALDYLSSRGYLNDSSFARELARASSERKLWGPLRIERKLRECGVGAEDIEGALRETFPEGEEAAGARALERFLRLGGSIEDRRGRARAYRHLLARGFSPPVAHRLVSKKDFEDTGIS